MSDPLPFLAEINPRPDFGQGAPAPGGSVIANPPPAISPGRLAELLRHHFGLAGDLAQLTSERDANFRLTLDDGTQLLIKIANDCEDRRVTAMQTGVLMHLAAAAPDLPVQRVHPSRTGAAFAEVEGDDGRRHVMRLVSYLSGVMQHESQPGPGLHRHMGETLARLTRALHGFTDPAARHVLQWDLAQAHDLRPLTPSVADPALRRRLLDRLDHFDHSIAPRLPELPSQVVHNDFNPHNLIVDAALATRIAGVIDFGDMVHTARACDLAVACSYHTGGTDPFAHTAEIVAGYHAILPLSAAEFALLPWLIGLRNVTTLSIASWRAARYPENSPYILRNAASSVRSLDALDALGAEAVAELLHAHSTARAETN